MPGGPLDGTRAGIADVTAASGQDGEVTAGLVALALSPLKLAATLCGEGPARSPPPPKLYQDYLSTPEVCTRTSRAARAGRAHSSTEDAGSRVKRGLDALMQIEKLKDRYSQHMQAASKAEELANDIDGGCKGEGANDMKARPPAGPAFRGINSASKPRESPSGSVGMEQLRSWKVPAAHRPERAETASAMARRSPPSLGGHSSRASSNEPLKVRFDDQVGAPATPGERKDQFETAAGRDEQADAGAPSTSARLQLVVGPDGEIMDRPAHFHSEVQRHIKKAQSCALIAQRITYHMSATSQESNEVWGPGDLRYY
eukprot:Tamp_20496.p1 GENE.Tamp_20496~~Tamp_20496.p1  ORF type:complete len:315 (+),score=23.92 Tamp_20496:211-1155(+)